ncbi:MAG: hypothetical protein RSE12_08875 [Fuscovulum sp.]|nr:MAG: hypothetical protein RSE12_08875 [Fuscovulum sp.]
MIDRRAVMQAAWTIARRFAGNRETWGQRLSRALKSVWWDAKEKARQAAEAIRAAAAHAEAMARTTVAELRAELDWLENSDARLGWQRQERISFLRRELDRRAA